MATGWMAMQGPEPPTDGRQKSHGKRPEIHAGHGQAVPSEGTGSYMSWREIVKATLERYGMLRAGNRIGVAVSGGADSVFLLRVLDELRLAAAVLHVNHRLRGAESDGDE